MITTRRGNERQGVSRRPWKANERLCCRWLCYCRFRSCGCWLWQRRYAALGFRAAGEGRASERTWTCDRGLFYKGGNMADCLPSLRLDGLLLWLRWQDNVRPSSRRLYWWTFLNCRQRVLWERFAVWMGEGAARLQSTVL